LNEENTNFTSSLVFKEVISEQYRSAFFSYACALKENDFNSVLQKYVFSNHNIIIANQINNTSSEEKSNELLIIGQRDNSTDSGDNNSLMHTDSYSTLKTNLTEKGTLSNHRNQLPLPLKPSTSRTQNLISDKRSKFLIQAQSLPLNSVRQRAQPEKLRPSEAPRAKIKKNTNRSSKRVYEETKTVTIETAVLKKKKNPSKEPAHNSFTPVQKVHYILQTCI
jgi:hypothetical protein